MISKLKTDGGRLAIVFNGSPLFTGDAGSGESEIRRWVIENDWLEAIIALPDQLFYNTGISTYLWIVTNRKPKARRGKIQLINAVDLFQMMRKSLGNKRHELSKDHIETVTRIYGDFQEGPHSKIFDNDDFGYRRLVVERPLRLSFQVTLERLELLREAKGFADLTTTKKKGAAGDREVEVGREQQEAIISALSRLDPGGVYRNRDQFGQELSASLSRAGLSIAAPVRRAILSAMSERDETADICKDADGLCEPDTDLRDYENVPLKEDVAAYFDREVRPHVPDAWIAGVEIRGQKIVVVDDSKVRVGYEIPFTRHFYKFKPLRPLTEIETDIRHLEGEIQGLLGEVLQ
jgi:type I restriction enzyme M protein